MIPKLKYSGKNFILLAGPCVIENEEMAFAIAEKVSSICDKLEIPYVFKGSYRKANRSRLDSFSGIGDIKALEILKAVGEKYNIPTVTDIHSAEEAAMAAKYVDVLQIPAFLCRQTDILVAAAKTGKDNTNKNAVNNTAQPNKGKRIIVIPGVRILKIVVIKFIAPIKEEIPAICKLKIAKSTDAPE